MSAVRRNAVPAVREPEQRSGVQSGRKGRRKAGGIGGIFEICGRGILGWLEFVGKEKTAYVSVSH